MSRKRFITSEISVDEKLAEIAQEDPVAALMWPWFCTALDDWGRLRAQSAKIKLDVFPGFPYTADDISRAMSLYHKVGIAVLYEMRDRWYLQANPAAFYRLNSYIQKSRQHKDSSNLPPPDHPWAEYWPESVWRDSNNKPQKATPSAEKLQEAAQSCSSPSPSPSPSKISTRGGGSLEAAREAEPELSAATAGQDLAMVIESVLPAYLNRPVSGADCQEVARWVADGVTAEMFPAVLDPSIAEFRRRNGEGKSPHNARWFAGAIYAELGRRRARHSPASAHPRTREPPSPQYRDMLDQLRAQGIDLDAREIAAADEEELF